MPLAHLSMLTYNKKSHQTQAEEYLKLQVPPPILLNKLLTYPIQSLEHSAA